VSIDEHVERTIPDDLIGDVTAIGRPRISGFRRIRHVPKLTIVEAPTQDPRTRLSRPNVQR
jgi:hypothetical protein